MKWLVVGFLVGVIVGYWQGVMGQRREVEHYRQLGRLMVKELKVQELRTKGPHLGQ
jgi:membrane protein DedA with SNARE-associated domain